MTNARLLAGIVILVSVVAEAGETAPARLIIQSSPKTVKTVAAQVLSRSGYTISNEEQDQTVFVKDLKGSAKFFTVMLMSPSFCKNVAPRQFLTLHFSETPKGTLATISIEIEHTAITPSCDVVREAPLRKRPAELDGILKKIRTDSEAHLPQNAAPVMNVDRGIRREPQTEDKWPTHFGF
jgi:hypothetical protein